MIGPTNQGIDSLIKQDSLACWREFADPDHIGFMTGEVGMRGTGHLRLQSQLPGMGEQPANAVRTAV